MGSVKDYFSSLGQGISSLLKGMQVTGKEFITPKITENIPKTATRSKCLSVSAPSSLLNTTRTDATNASPAVCVNAVAPTAPYTLPQRW